MKVIGLAGWSGAGKTTLLTNVIPHLVANGLRVSTIKHAHHDFDIDVPGKDSWNHRQAGATEVLVSSGRRWALMHELRDTHEPSLSDLLTKLSNVDLVIVEGFRSGRHPKLEVYRASNNQPLIFQKDADVVGVISNDPIATDLPVVRLDDVSAVSTLMRKSAIEIADLVAREKIGVSS